MISDFKIVNLSKCSCWARHVLELVTAAPVSSKQVKAYFYQIASEEGYVFRVCVIKYVVYPIHSYHHSIHSQNGLTTDFGMRCVIRFILIPSTYIVPFVPIVK